ncbi:MAG: type II secretion system protein GspL [Colwellia sp.]
MAEILTIRLGSQVKDEIFWLIYNRVEKEVIASGELKNATQLTALTDKAQHRSVQVLVPSCDVLLKRLKVPTKSQRATRAAVPYMLEDELAQDVDDLFFAYADLPTDDDDNNCFVAVVEKAQMQTWKNWLSDANIATKIIMPEVLALPYAHEPTVNESNTHKPWSVIALTADIKSQVVVRQGLWQGFTLDASAWPFMLEQITKASSHKQDSLPINAYSTLPHSDNLTLNTMEAEPPLALFSQHSQASKFNLLQGEFKVKDQHSKNLTHWLWVAGIAVCALLLNVGYKSAQLWQINVQQSQVEEQIIARYKKTFPRTKRVRIGTIKSQLNKKIAQLGGTSDSRGFLAMLAKVQPAFAKVPDLKPESLKFDGKRQELRLQATANEYQHFEQFKNALNTANLAIKQGAQSNQGDQVTGSFSISNKASNTKYSTKQKSKGRS